MAPPSDFLTLVARQRPVADGLVLLVEFRPEELDHEVDAADRALREHLLDGDRWLDRAGTPSLLSVAKHRQLRAEHLAFRGSTDELRHLWDVVRAVDHGGNRQALGQYWRVLLEALTLHLEDELPLERAARRDLPGRTIR